jgi:hypothetical protein
MKRTEVQKALGPLGVLVACSQVSPLVEFSGEDAARLLVAAGGKRELIITSAAASSDGNPYVFEIIQLTVAGAHLRATWRRAATPAEIAYLECHAKQQAFLFLDVDIAEASHG